MPTTIDTFYTNSEGYLVIPEKLEYGSKYYLIEVQAPYGTVRAKKGDVDTEIVVFESLYRKGVEIAVHENIKDKGQTVKIDLAEPDIPQTGDSPLTGFLIVLGAIALGGLTSIGIIHFKRRKDDDK